MSKPITIYVLECQNSKYYVGKTTRSIKERSLEHLAGDGCYWTKQYPPVRLIKAYFECDTLDEDKVTKEYMMKYGIDNVRGGSYTSSQLFDYQLRALNNEFKTAKNACYYCGSLQHFVDKCPEKLATLPKKLNTELLKIQSSIKLTPMEEILNRFNRILTLKEVLQPRIDKLKEFSAKLDETQKQKVNDIVDKLEEGKIKKPLLTKIQKFVDEHEQESTIITSMSFDVIERKLDSNVKDYIGYSIENPMAGVKFNTASGRYIGRHNGHTFSSYDASTVCLKMLNSLKELIYTNKIELTDVGKIGLEYNKKNMLIIGDKGNAYFDIQHVLQLLNLKENTVFKKYNEFYDKITHYTVEKNEFGGYIIRELVAEDVAYDIILSSKSEFSKSFRGSISKIITDARKDGKLVANTKTGAIEYDKHQKMLTPSDANALHSQRSRKLPEFATVSAIPCVYCVKIGTVYDMKDTMNFSGESSDDAIVVKFGMTDNLSDVMNTCKTCLKDVKFKLKYFAWIDDIFQTDAEKNLATYFEKYKKFEYSHMHFAIMSKEELHNVRTFYAELFNKYGTKYKSMIDKYKHDISKLKHIAKLHKKEFECQLERMRTDHALQLLKYEKEKSELLQTIVELKQVKPKRQRKTPK